MSNSESKSKLGLLRRAGWLVAAIAAAAALWQARVADRAEQRAQAAEGRADRAEVLRLLADAWDELGGREGTTVIVDYNRDKTRLELARRNIERALELVPDSSEAFRHLGSYYQAIGNYDEAVKAFQDALANNPDRPAVTYSQLANVRIEECEWEKAEEAIGKALELDSEFAVAYNSRATLYHTLRRLQEAERATLKAVDLQPNDPIFLTNLGSVYAAQGRLQEAETKHRKAVDLAGKGMARVHFNLATTLLFRQSLDASEQEFRSAIAIDPKHAESLQGLAFLLYRNGNLPDAERYARNAVNADPRFAKAHDLLGTILHDLRRHDEAALELATAQDLYSSDCVAASTMAPSGGPPMV